MNREKDDRKQVAAVAFNMHQQWIWLENLVRYWADLIWVKRWLFQLKWKCIKLKEVISIPLNFTYMTLHQQYSKDVTAFLSKEQRDSQQYSIGRSKACMLFTTVSNRMPTNVNIIHALYLQRVIFSKCEQNTRLLLEKFRGSYCIRSRLTISDLKLRKKGRRMAATQ